MAINNHIYSDLDLTFLRQPSTGDVAMRYDEQSVIRSVRSLLFTNVGERLFQPNLGSTLNSLLFEPVSPLTASQIEDEVARVIANFEPRATINEVFVVANPDSNSFQLYLSVFIGNQTSPSSISLILKRSR
jgi:phage baseplate assembly protein W